MQTENSGNDAKTYDSIDIEERDVDSLQVVGPYQPVLVQQQQAKHHNATQKNVPQVSH